MIHPFLRHQKPNKRNPNAYAEIVGSSLWEKFRITELTEITRQQDDLRLAVALGNLVKGELKPEELDLFKSREVQPQDVPEGVLHLFVSNKELNMYNDQALMNLRTETATSTAVDSCQGDAAPAVKETDVHGFCPDSAHK